MKENYFLDYNVKNILTNLLQSEDHAKYIREKFKPEHMACITKHLLITRGEISEAISHSSVVDPGKKEMFVKSLGRVDQLIDDIKVGEKENLLLKLRGLRKDLEGIDKSYDTKECKLCNPNVDEYLEKTVKDLNIDKTNNINIESNGVKIMKESMGKIALIGGSQFVGIGVREVGGYIDTAMGKTASPSYAKPSTWIDIGGGLVMAILPQFMKMGDKLTTVLTVVGTQRLADRIISLAKEYAVPTASYRRVVPTTSLGMTRPIAVGGLVTVD
jgi:hypothetical protein